MSKKGVDYSKWDKLVDDKSDEEEVTAPRRAPLGQLPFSLNASDTQAADVRAIMRAAEQALNAMNLDYTGSTSSSTRDSSAARVKPSTSSSSGPPPADGRLPFTKAEMHNYKVRFDASAPDPSLELHKCVVCRKSPAAGARFLLCQRCHAMRYCSIDCQREDWDTRHRGECGDAKSLFEGHQLRGNEHAVRYVKGRLDPDAFYRLQRAKNAAIQREVPRSPALNNTRLVNLSAYFLTLPNAAQYKEWCGIQLSRGPNGDDVPGPSIADPAVMAIGPTHFHTAYRIAPLSLVEAARSDLPLPLHLHTRGRGVAVVKRLVEDIVHGHSRDGGFLKAFPAVPWPIIEGHVDIFFWRGDKIQVQIGEAPFVPELTIECLFIPSHNLVVRSALLHAACAVFGQAGYDEIDRLLPLSASKAYKIVSLKAQLTRGEWQRDIIYEIMSTEGLPAALIKLYHDRAKELGVEVGAVQREFRMEA